MGPRYRYLANGLDGFVARIVVLAQKGYRYASFFTLEPDKVLEDVDRKILAKYDVCLSKDQRYRRKQQGAATVQYVRYERFCVLLCTRGRQLFFEPAPEGESVKKWVEVTTKKGTKKEVLREVQIKNLRKVPLRICGYSIALRCDSRDHAQLRAVVRMDKEQREIIRAGLLEVALRRRNGNALWNAIWKLDVAPYAKVREQLFEILQECNEERKKRGYAAVPASCIRWKFSTRNTLLPWREHWMDSWLDVA